jgi:hypothetical protein
MDVPVHQVFTEDMFVQLEQRMKTVGWKSVRPYWENDFKNRAIVSEFLRVRWGAVMYVGTVVLHQMFSAFRTPQLVAFLARLPSGSITGK